MPSLSRVSSASWLSCSSDRKAAFLSSTILCAYLLLAGTQVSLAQANDEDDTALPADTVSFEVIISGEEQGKQSLGTSVIGSEQLEKTPVVNDISEIIRKMPGSNLTGTSSSGQRGNQRQIDLRGMGPENTLILIDGKPVLSRNSVRMGRSGERDSRGDSNWVPAEAIDRIEVIRGPAAARYGSGASGGVVNIITKRPEKTTATLSTTYVLPEDNDEGRTFRTNLSATMPVSDKLIFQLFANYSRTGADAADINSVESVQTNAPAGREGIKNFDVRGVMSYEANESNRFDFEAAFSRQGNIFTGDSLLSANGGNVGRLQSLVGEETNVMERLALSATHKGSYDFGESESYLQWERTVNRRLNESLSGGSEGSITSDLSFGTSELNNLTAKSEWDIPVKLYVDQMLTIGGEFRGEWLHDPISNQQTLDAGGSIPGISTDPADRDPDASNWLLGLYLEDNIYATDKLTLTPGVRVDYNPNFGFNFSPSLNGFYELTDEITFKAGIARAFKAPNLYQINQNYLMYSRGNGCRGYQAGSRGGCYLIGNEDLNPETSLNKEIGVSYENADGWYAGITYFHNDYKDRITAGWEPVAYTNSTVPIFKWENVPEAVVSGLEGSLTVPLHETLTWRTNATYMLESENKQNGQPLSLVPDYTINTWLDWEAREDLTITLSATHYGETPAPTQNITTGQPVNSNEPVDPYTLVHAAFTYKPTEKTRITAGVNNIFDKRVYRKGSGNNAGSNTYNESGRTFHVTMSATF